MDMNLLDIVAYVALDFCSHTSSNEDRMGLSKKKSIFQRKSNTPFQCPKGELIPRHNLFTTQTMRLNNRSGQQRMVQLFSS